MVVIRDHEIIINVDDPNISGNIYYKRFKTNDDWTNLKLEYKNGKFIHIFLINHLLGN